MPRPTAIAESLPTPGSGGVESIAIPLRAIIAHLPGELQAKVRRRPEAADVARVSVNTVLEQLPRGSIKITLTELIKASPPDTFDVSLVDCLNPVQLPLQEILPQLKSSQLSRRPHQKRVQVPVDVAPIFGARGEHLVPLLAPSPNKLVAPSSARASTSGSPSATPPSVNGFSARREPAAISPAGPSNPSSTAPIGRPVGPSAPGQPVTRPIPSVPHGSLTSLGTAAPTPPPVGKNGVIQVPLEVLMQHWPEPLCREIARHNLTRGTVALPIHDIEPALKRGKVVVPWKQVRAWLGSSVAGPVASVHDDLALELRLGDIVPLFLAQHKPARAPRLATVAPGIPNLFSRPARAPTTPPEVEPSVVKSVPVFATKPAPAAETGPVLPDLGQIFGQSDKRHWTPMEIVQWTTHLRGVAGAVIALQDGLLVASELPPEVNGDAFAAFLPQMHSRVAQCTKEINLGEPSRICVVLGQVPLLIVKAGRVFLAALGRAGHDLPEATLMAIAAQLAKLSK
jgi:predicted regulator of Ras-like GTPase activity (Roadblock/LC7/MglB family)